MAKKSQDEAQQYDPEADTARRREVAGRKFASLADQLVEALETTPIACNFEESEEDAAKEFKKSAASGLKRMMVDSDRKEGRRFRG